MHINFKMTVSRKRLMLENWYFSLCTCHVMSLNVCCLLHLYPPVIRKRRWLCVLDKSTPV